MLNLSNKAQEKFGKIGKTLAALILSSSLVIFLAACNEKGPMEKAGESVDEAVEDAGDAVEDAGDNIDDKTSH